MSKQEELYVAQKEIFNKEYDLYVDPTPKTVTLKKVKYNPSTGKYEDVSVKNMAQKKKELEAQNLEARNAYQLGGNFHTSRIQHEVRTWEKYKEIVQNTPIGGFVRVKFMNDITSTSDVFAGCSVYINLNGHKLKCGHNPDTKQIYYIYRTNEIFNGHITILNGKIETADETYSRGNENWYLAPISSWAGRMGVYLYKVDIYLNKSILINQYSLGTLEVIVDYCSIYKGNTFVANKSRVIGGSYASYNGRIQATTLNNGLKESDVFGGTPRKV